MSYTPQCSLNPDVAVPGLLADEGDRHIASRINKAVKQVTTVTIVTASTQQEYDIVINGVICAYTSTASGNATTIAAGLATTVNTNDFNGDGLSFNVTAATSTAAVVITADDYGVPVTVTALPAGGVTTVATGTYAGGAIPMGVGVAKGSADNLCRLPQASTDKLLGISVLDQSQPMNDDGEMVYDMGSMVNVLEQGRIWVTVEDAVVSEGDVYVRYLAGANGSQRGAFRSDADSSKAAQLTGAKYETSADAGALAIVNVNKP